MVPIWNSSGHGSHHCLNSIQRTRANPSPMLLAYCRVGGRSMPACVYGTHTSPMNARLLFFVYFVYSHHLFPPWDLHHHDLESHKDCHCPALISSSLSLLDLCMIAASLHDVALSRRQVTRDKGDMSLCCCVFWW